MTLALRVLAAPDHPELAPGSVQRLPHAGIDEHGTLAGRQLALGEVIDLGALRFALVDALSVLDGAYSYNQIMVIDGDAPLEGNWSKRHFNQGFLRSDRHLSLRTSGGSGHALVRVFLSNYLALAEDDRVIAVPFRVTTGEIRIMAPDDVLVAEHVVAVPAGEYRLVTCQRFHDRDEIEGDEDVDLFFERVDLPRQRSEIIVADRELQPQLPLLESDRA